VSFFSTPILSFIQPNYQQPPSVLNGELSQVTKLEMKDIFHFTMGLELKDVFVFAGSDRVSTYSVKDLKLVDTLQV
jgi:hypothetical protein